MTASNPVIRLTEYVPCRVPVGDLTDEEARYLWREFGKQIAIETPSFKTENCWSLTSEGWVGFIPLSRERGLSIAPKVSIRNVLSMLIIAYDLESFRFLPGLFEAASVEDFLDLLAAKLAELVERRIAKGLYRTYVAQTEPQGYVRGRISLTDVARAPWRVSLPCDYQDHTADIQDNQILAWTLERISRSGLCTDLTGGRVRHAFWTIRGAVGSTPSRPEDCIGRLYNRLNDDYEGMHAICRFFLEQLGPSHETGDRAATPFLVNMAGLYERFVARWLMTHLPEGLSLKIQDNVRVGDDERIQVSIDLVLYDSNTARAVTVLDTKYKAAGVLSTPDLFQIVAYANMKDCSEAILVFPIPLARALQAKIGEITVRSLTFALEGDLNANGTKFLGDLLQKGSPRLLHENRFS